MTEILKNDNNNDTHNEKKIVKDTKSAEKRGQDSEAVLLQIFIDYLFN